jgi:hypothetical protein
MTRFLIHRHPQTGLNDLLPAGTALAPAGRRIRALTQGTPKVEE